MAEKSRGRFPQRIIAQPLANIKKLVIATNIILKYEITRIYR